MSKTPFTLTLLDDGKAILSCEENLPPEVMQEFRRTWNAWSASPSGLAVMFIANCSVKRQTTFEVDLDDSS